MTSKIREITVDYFNQSYHSDRVAFYFEVVAVTIVITINTFLAIVSKDGIPASDMIIYYPIQIVGSIAGVYAYYRREIFWPMLINAYFVLFGIVGLCRSLGLF